MWNIAESARVAIVLLLLLPFSVWGERWQFDGVERVVAISDIHGAYDAMVATLKNAGVTDDENSWSGGAAHLVTVGDILDRGADSRPVMDLLMALESQAETAGGKVHVLIGNHESMNLVGDLRYVARGEFAAFAEEESAEDRERWLEHYVVHKSESGEISDAVRSEFDERFPPGFFGHRRAFASDGKYGRWLLEKPVVVVINRTAFVHGGLSPMIAEIGLDGVNETLVGEMAEYVALLDPMFEAGILSPMDSFYAHPRVLKGYMPSPTATKESIDAVSRLIELNESDLHASDGPLWYRGNVACGRVIESRRLRSALDAIGADRVVIGHTPTPGRRVLERFDGEIIEVDTGMLSGYYNGSGNALVIEGARLFVVNESSPEILTPQPHPRQVGIRPGGFLSVEDTENLLATGELSNERKDAQGRTIVTVSDGERRIDAVFEKRSGREFYPELAAYRLDRLLELDMIPATVKRSIGRREGSLQFLPTRYMDEAQRSQEGRGGSANCPLPEQWMAMYIFDTLVYNEGRSLDRMLYGTDTWQMILVGHEKAFGASEGRPRHLASVDLEIGQGWRDALNGLSDEVIDRVFDGILDKRRRASFKARRDALLAN